MTAIRLKLVKGRQSLGSNGNTVDPDMWRIAMQVTHKSLTRLIMTDCAVLPTEWNVRKGSFIFPDNPERLKVIKAYRESLSHDTARLRRIVANFERTSTEFSADNVVEAFSDFMADYSLNNFMHQLIDSLIVQGRIRTAETYETTLRSFMRYTGGRDVMIDSFTPEMMADYESYLRRSGLSPNTTSFYMRILRAVYNNAVRRGAFDSTDPFTKVYTGIEKTRKRALPLNDVRRLRRLDLSDHPALEYARDIFMLSFYLRGMSLIDMAFLRKTDLRNGHLSYRRHKTGQKISVEWTSELQRIVDKYPKPDSPYLLPIIFEESDRPHAVYRKMSYRINYSLKRIAKLLHYPSSLTLYCARHSWASIAQSKNIPISVISAGMGHNSEKTTRRYLASLDSSVIDKANSMIMEAVQ